MSSAARRPLRSQWTTALVFVPGVAALAAGRLDRDGLVVALDSESVASLAAAVAL